VTPGAILDTLKAHGVSLTRDGEDLIATPKAALTDELRALIKAHKPELLEAVGKVEPAEPSPEDKDFFRSILPGSTLAKYAGTDAEDRRAKVLDQLQDPSIKRAMAISPDGLVTVGVRFEGGVWTADLKIPEGTFDPFLILARFEKATLQ
jgi:hypothetical protein